MDYARSRFRLFCFSTSMLDAPPAELPDDECRQVIARNAPLLAKQPNFTAEKLSAYVQTASANGYALNFGLMHPEMAAVGVPSLSEDGQWSAALSVTTITSRMGEDRLRFIVDLLQREAVGLREKLWPGGIDGRVPLVLVTTLTATITKLQIGNGKVPSTHEREQ